MPPFRTRFAPTTNGPMHLGHARTHLLTWLYAQREGGTVIMRLDDLDRQRFRQDSVDDFLRMHEWLGLHFDEGPYFQSNRVGRYEEVLETLRGSGRVYACSCSRSAIVAARPGDAGDGGLRYPGTCRGLGLELQDDRAWRFAWEGLSPGFEDEVFGSIAPGGVRGDFILRRADGVIAYHLASVVDDHDFGITRVIRGQDLLVATSRQVLLFEALGWEVPVWAHLPLVYGEDGKKLSKSHASTGISTLRDAGWSAQRVLGVLAHSLGWTPTPEPCSLDDLRGAFEMRSVGRASAKIALPVGDCGA